MVSLCSGSDGGESSYNFRQPIAPPIYMSVEQERLCLPQRAVSED